jgi:hypothetical protein
MSDLEREFELEMEDADYPANEAIEQDGEFELEMEDADYPANEAIEQDGEFELEMEERKTDDLAQKFFELSQQSFESELDIDNKLNSLLTESEYFLWNKLKKLGKSTIKGLATKAWNHYGKLPVFKSLKAITGNARTLMKGPLGAAFKSIASVHPGGAAALTALKALGLSEVNDNNLELWKNYTNLVKESYEQLAENFDERSATDPALASRLVSRAFETARLKQKGYKNRDSRRSRSIRVRARRGQRIIIDIV